MRKAGYIADLLVMYVVLCRVPQVHGPSRPADEMAQDSPPRSPYFLVTSEMEPGLTSYVG